MRMSHHNAHCTFVWCCTLTWSQFEWFLGHFQVKTIIWKETGDFQQLRQFMKHRECVYQVQFIWSSSVRLGVNWPWQKRGNKRWQKTQSILFPFLVSTSFNDQIHHCLPTFSHLRHRGESIDTIFDGFVKYYSFVNAFLPHKEKIQNVNDEYFCGLFFLAHLVQGSPAVIIISKDCLYWEFIESLNLKRTLMKKNPKKMLRKENEQFWQFNSFFKKTTWRPRTCASDDSWVESKRVHIGLWYQLKVSCLSSIPTKNRTLYLMINLAESDLFARETYFCPCIRAQEANSGTYRGLFERQYQGEEKDSWCSCLARHSDLFHHQKKKMSES